MSTTTRFPTSSGRRPGCSRGPLLAEPIAAIIDLPARFAPRMTLGIMAPHLPERLRETPSNSYCPTPEVKARRAVVPQATRVWPTRIGVTEIDIIRRCLDGTDLDNRVDLLAAASDLLERVAGVDMHLSCLDDIRAVERWWPRVAG